MPAASLTGKQVLAVVGAWTLICLMAFVMLWRHRRAGRATHAFVLACSVYVLGGAVVLAAASWAAKHVV